MMKHNFHLHKSTLIILSILCINEILSEKSKNDLFWLDQVNFIRIKNLNLF